MLPDAFWWEYFFSSFHFKVALIFRDYLVSVWNKNRFYTLIHLSNPYWDWEEEDITIENYCWMICFFLLFYFLILCYISVIIASFAPCCSFFISLIFIFQSPLKWFGGYELFWTVCSMESFSFSFNFDIIFLGTGAYVGMCVLLDLEVHCSKPFWTLNFLVRN